MTASYAQIRVFLEKALSGDRAWFYVSSKDVTCVHGKSPNTMYYMLSYEDLADMMWQTFCLQWVTVAWCMLIGKE